MRLYEVLKELEISEYILCVHSLSGVLACKLMKKSITCQALPAIEPTIRKLLFIDFSGNPYLEMEEQMRLIEEYGPEFYFKNLTQARFDPEIDETMWKIMQEKASELENQDPGFQISGEITEEDFADMSLATNVPVFVFCQVYREKEYRELEYWSSKTKLILGGSHHYLQWSE